MELNWVDWVILAAVAFYIIDGWERGMVNLLGNLASFLGSLWLAVKYHAPVGNFLADKFGLPAAWVRLAGYLLVAVVSEAVLSEGVALFFAKFPKKIFTSKVNHWLGAVLSALSAAVVTAFILLLVLALPLRGTVKQDIKSSGIGSPLVRISERYGGRLTSSLDEVTREVIKFLTIQPQSRERINLEVKPAEDELVVDEVSESRMVELVNAERRKVGLSELRLDVKIREVARAHSRDMFEKRYFSHYSSVGRDAGDRLESVGISFSYAGENLAYAPDVDTAHRGLMDSESHRANILDSRFRRVGVGVIDAGIYGQMFTQVFAD